MSSNRPALDRDEAQRTLTELAAGHDEAAALMYRLDSHTALAVLRDSPAGGRTGRLWAALRPRIQLAWAHFNAAGDLLDAARAVRTRRHRPTDGDLAELTALLREPVVGFDADGLPAAATGSAPVRRATLGELLRELTAQSCALIDELARVQCSVDAVTARLAALTDQLAALRADAAGLSDGTVERIVHALDGTLERLRGEALTDPVGAAPDGALESTTARRLDRLAAELRAARSQLAELAALRSDYPATRARLGGQVSDVRAAEAAAARAYRKVAAKIADPGLPPVPDASTDLRRRLDGLDESYRHARWAQLAGACAELERDARRSAQRATALEEAALGLLERRAELRGRLEAYRAKAARLGVVEHESLSMRHRRARDLLYTAPCDLPAATRAVLAYQQCVADLTHQPVAADPADSTKEPR